MSALKKGEIYSTQRVDPERKRDPWAIPSELVPPDSWFIPVLVGGGSPGETGRERGLTLYHVTKTPPQLVVRKANPTYQSKQEMGDLFLWGVDLSGVEVGSNDLEVQAGGRLHVVLYWRIPRLKRVMVGTRLGNTSLETHTPGFGNLTRYVREQKPPRDGVLVEDYWVVIPSTIPPGLYPLSIGIVEPSGLGQSQAKWLDSAEITVVRVTE